MALTRKNFLLAYRNRTATFLRILSSFFFLLLIFLVNEALKGRFAKDPYYKDFPEPPREVIGGIPACVPKDGAKCWTFVYTPAPDSMRGIGFSPINSFTSFDDFKSSASVSNCEPRLVCEEMFRVHRVVRGIMDGNEINGQKMPIPSDNVLGFRNQTTMDDFLFDNAGRVQGGYVFSAPSDRAVTFALQINSTSSSIRGVWQRPYITVALPMQTQAHRSIAQFINPGSKMEIASKLFAHPAFDVSTFEGIVAPLFLLGCAMFPFVIQMNEVVMERELKLRQALQAMGLHDTAYWLSWHMYQSGMALLFGFFIWVFGMIFQLKMFHKNDFGIVFLTFWLFGQAMVGLGFLVGSFLSRSAQAVTAGFAIFLVGFVLYFMISFANFPYGGNSVTPFSYETNITTKNLTRKTSSDVVLEPLLALAPPTLLIKCIGDMGEATAADTAKGIRFNDAYSYCTLANACNPDYSIGNCWGCFIALYIIYSLLGLFFENVLPDAMGVRKSPLYFCSPSYWGLTQATVKDKVMVIEASTDEDVIAEENLARQRENQPMASSSAIEIRGLRATFTRGGKSFHAVKCPWYCVGKRQLFALLGPNGAGKTTTINMLTGFLPPTDGNALVFGETVSHPSGMAKIRKFMGMCPQFDILWDNLSAKEHLVLFGTIKGLKADSITAEANKRIEEVRLTESANQRAGAFSGGMKRRLSVAVALIGNPEVVYLDEPTTGMDPINRRHVWDVVETAKQDRSVVLTTHSMEEADILGDRIGIMAKGRLRCLGTSVRLKTRFGEGYKVSVSCGDNMKPDSDSCLAVKSFFREKLDLSATEETKAYMHFNVPVHHDNVMAQFFSDLDGRQHVLGIVDVQLSMSTLEDVFLKVATASELEDAKLNQKTIVVTLRSNENVGVIVGCEDTLTSPAGVTFTVKWGTDEDGRLIPVETKEVEMQEQEVVVTCPEGIAQGQDVQVMLSDKAYTVQVPPGVSSGQQFKVAIRVPKAISGGFHEETTMSQYIISQDEIRSRVQKLHTPFSGQANALLRKNLSFQWKRRVTNCCLVLVPLFVLALVFGIQALLEILFLGTGRVRCPYCGPSDDDFGKLYCNKKNCVDFFFSNSSRQEYINIYGVDVIARCAAIAGDGPLGKKDPSYCGGGGDISCFQTQWTSGAQIAFCPFKARTIPTQPPIGFAPLTSARASSPVMFTSDPTSKGFAEKVGSKSSLTANEIKEKTRGVMKESTRQLFQLFASVPLLGCHGSNLSAQKLLPAICRLLLPNENDVCCLDLTGNRSALLKCIREDGSPSTEPACLALLMGSNNPNPSSDGLSEWQQGKFEGSLVSGENYWSDIPELHNPAAYSTYMTTCLQDPSMTRGVCNMQIMTAWAGIRQAGRYGVRFGSGKGQILSVLEVPHLLLMQSTMPGQTQLPLLVLRDLLNTFPNQSSFQCFKPEFNSAMNSKYSRNTCINIEEGMAVLSKAENVSANVHPISAGEKSEIPECIQRETCTFTGIKDDVLGEFQADTHGRWAQICNFYTSNLAQTLALMQAKCRAEFGTNVCPKADEELRTYMNRIPCMCRWQYFTRAYISRTIFPSGFSATSLLQFPRLYQCRRMSDGSQDCSPSEPSRNINLSKPAALSQSGCWRRHYHPFSMPELKFVSSIWPKTDFFYRRRTYSFS